MTTSTSPMGVVSIEQNRFFSLTQWDDISPENVKHTVVEKLDFLAVYDIKWIYFK